MKLGYIAINQYGDKVEITKNPRKELMEWAGTTKIEKMYVDTKDGLTKHVGYIVQNMWFTVYEIHEWAK